jgi:hypothetical protein
VTVVVCITYKNGDMGCTETPRQDVDEIFADVRVGTCDQKGCLPGVLEHRPFPISGAVLFPAGRALGAGRSRHPRPRRQAEPRPAEPTPSAQLQRRVRQDELAS